MCGLVMISYGPGGAAAEPWTPTEMMQLMLPAIVHRGKDAFGWMAWSGQDIKIHKEAGSVANKYKRIKIAGDAQWVVGHVRAHTHGSPQFNGNNHPIIHGSVVGVHNGVIRNYDDILRQTGREDDRVEVDSEAIFAAINKWGHKEGLARVAGDMVAIYTKTDRPSTLWVARSSLRPLVVATTPAGTLLMASEVKAFDALDMPLPYKLETITARNQIMQVRAGKITKREQYAKPPPRDEGWSAPYRGAWRGSAGSTIIGGRTSLDGLDEPFMPLDRYPASTRGITDAFDRSHTVIGTKMEDGATYVGGGFILKSGRRVSVTQYVQLKEADAAAEAVAAMINSTEPIGDVLSADDHHPVKEEVCQ